MKKFALLVFCLVLALGIGWGQAGLVTNPAVINQDYIAWCANFGCPASPYVPGIPSPQPWVSNAGLTGTVGLNGGFQNFSNPLNGVTWAGNFPTGMGLIYNNRLWGNTDAGIVTTFDTGVYAAGAYIQSDYYGPFTAYVTLFDQNSNVIATFSALGTSNGTLGTALFIGASDTVPFYAMQFDVVDHFGINDVAIGTEWVNTTPEPGTLVLFGSSVLGLAGCLRRRFL